MIILVRLRYMNCVFVWRGIKIFEELGRYTERNMEWGAKG